MQHLARYRASVAVIAIYLSASTALALRPMTADADDRPFLPRTAV